MIQYKTAVGFYCWGLWGPLMAFTAGFSIRAASVCFTRWVLVKGDVCGLAGVGDVCIGSG